MEYNLWKFWNTMLHIWNYYNVVNQLYLNFKNLRRKIKFKSMLNKYYDTYEWEKKKEGRKERRIKKAMEEGREERRVRKKEGKA